MSEYIESCTVKGTARHMKRGAVLHNTPPCYDNTECCTTRRDGGPSVQHDSEVSRGAVRLQSRASLAVGLCLGVLEKLSYPPRGNATRSVLPQHARVLHNTVVLCNTPLPQHAPTCAAGPPLLL